MIDPVNTSPSKWPRIVAVVAAVFGPLATLIHHDLIHDVRGAAILLGGFAAVAATAAAAILLVATAIARVRQRPFVIVASERATRTVLITGGIGLLVLAVTMASLGLPGLDTALVIGLPGAGLVVAARWVPARPRTFVIALLALVGATEVLRERGTLSITWQHSETSTRRDYHGGWTCATMDGPATSIAALTKRWRLQANLVGNVGELVVAPIEVGNASGELVAMASGQIETDWATCLLPLHKSIEIDANLTLDYSVHNATQSCHGGGPLEIHITRTIDGISSCYSAREAAANDVLDQLAAVAQDAANGR
jgi:hypothetical protein